jgi:hypothetical protein
VDNSLLAFDVVQTINDKLHDHYKIPQGFENVKVYTRRGACLAEYEQEARSLSTFLLYVCVR